MTEESTPSQWLWLQDTYWYVPAGGLPALQTQQNNTYAWAFDQTVWHITGSRQNYIWGVQSALITPSGEEADLVNKQDGTFFGSITPEGRVHMTFVQGNITLTTGIGVITTNQGLPSFEMQMSAGPATQMTVHWAYMMPVKEGEPAWDKLPGVNASVPDMVGDLEAPTLATDS